MPVFLQHYVEGGLWKVSGSYGRIWGRDFEIIELYTPYFQ